MISTVIQVLVSVGVVNWQISNIDGLCTKHQAEKFTCPGPNTFMQPLLFGVSLVPSVYFVTCIHYFSGVFSLALLQQFPFATAQVFPAPNKVLSAHVGYWWNVVVCTIQFDLPNRIVVLVDSLYVVYSSPILELVGKVYLCLVVVNYCGRGVFSNHYIFAVQYHPKKLTWWGNSVSYAGADSAGGSLIKVPEGQILDHLQASFHDLEELFVWFYCILLLLFEG